MHSVHSTESERPACTAFTLGADFTLFPHLMSTLGAVRWTSSRIFDAIVVGETGDKIEGGEQRRGGGHWHCRTHPLERVSRAHMADGLKRHVCVVGRHVCCVERWLLDSAPQRGFFGLRTLVGARISESRGHASRKSPLSLACRCREQARMTEGKRTK